MDPEPAPGTPVAQPDGMLRRLTAMIGIVILLGLALALMWRVYLHHERSLTPSDEPALVSLGSHHG